MQGIPPATLVEPWKITENMWKIMEKQWKIMETDDKSVENYQNDGSAVDLGIPSLKTNRYTNRREIMLLVMIVGDTYNKHAEKNGRINKIIS